MVYYRKYRPQTISELDLESVRTRLTAILRAKELPHAFLFTGPKGLGKTSSARILAKAINCESNQEARIKNQGEKAETKFHDSKFMIHNSNFEPCNHCDACISITNGSNIDVLEIDAASNRGIDEIRDLREKIKFAPASLKKKVYIIDEVHMLTTDAFNALLKTLEEPPSHAVFILCTTEVEKVPATIASRTFHVQFSKPTVGEITNSLQRIANGEKVEVDSVVYEEIFKAAEGSFRDAAKILEELVIGSPDKKITKEIFEITYKTSNLDSEIGKLFNYLSKKDLKNSMKIIQDLSEKGTDFKILTERIALSLHDMLIASASAKPGAAIDNEFKTQDLKKLLDLINESYKLIKFSVLPQIPLELAIVEWCIPEEGNPKADNATMPNPQPPLSPQLPKVAEIPQSSELAVTKPIKTPEPNVLAEGKSTNSEQRTTNSDSHGDLFRESSKPDNFLAAFFAKIKLENHSIAGILRGCQLVEITSDTVVFKTSYKFHRDKLTDAKTSLILDRCASDVLKENLHVVVNLVEK